MISMQFAERETGQQFIVIVDSEIMGQYIWDALVRAGFKSITSRPLKKS